MLPERFATERLILRPIETGDAGAIFTGYAQDPDVVRFLTFRPHRGLTDTLTYIARCLATPASRGRTYVLIRRADGDLLGAFELRWLEPHRLDCGYVLGRPWWGHGLMTEVLTTARARFTLSNAAAVERAAWTQVTRVLINLDEFITRE